jgi:hypothetical protein
VGGIELGSFSAGVQLAGIGDANFHAARERERPRRIPVSSAVLRTSLAVPNPVGNAGLIRVHSGEIGHTLSHDVAPSEI